LIAYFRRNRRKARTPSAPPAKIERVAGSGTATAAAEAELQSATKIAAANVAIDEILEVFISVIPSNVHQTAFVPQLLCHSEK